MPKFRAVVAIPTRELYSGEVDYASIPGIDGDYGVLSGHESFVGLNRTGALTLWFDAEGKERAQFLIMGGATQVLNNHLSVLPRFGCRIDEIDPVAVRAELASLDDAGMLDSEDLGLDRMRRDRLRAEGMAWCEARLRAVGETDH